MIARLKGLLDSTAADACVVDVNGVGYLVSASSKTLGALGGNGSAVMLHIETQVREDAIQLFGFLGEAERDSFRLLTTVQGVGGRVALAILSVLGPDELAHAIAAADTASPPHASSSASSIGSISCEWKAWLVRKRSQRTPSPANSSASAATIPAGPDTTRCDPLSAASDTAGYRPSAAAIRSVEANTASIAPACAPSAGSAPIRDPRASASRKPSSSDSTPAACAAASSPTECPITTAGFTPRLAHSATRPACSA